MIAIRNSLATIFSAVARGIASHPSYSRWTADDASPGYLVARVAGFELRAPWNVVTDFADDAVLGEFLGHAATVKLKGDSVICLSGSLLMKSVVGAISDVDLCEYVAGTDQGFPKVAAQAMSTDGPEVICFQIGAHVAQGLSPTPKSVSIERPWSKESSEEFLRSVAVAGTGKCDFAVISQSEGVVEMTKIVLHVDSRYPDTEGAWDLSFPFQEMVVNGGSWVPRRLASPQSVGRYVVWLFREVEHHASSAPVKAAKRALSLARILNSKALAEAAQSLLRQDDLALKAVLKARLKFQERLSGIKDPAIEPYCAQLANTVKVLAKAVGINTEDLEGEGSGDEKSGESRAIAALLEELPVDTAEIEKLVSGFKGLLEPAIRMGRY
jgi:uncharacterized protein YsxB (DUF464 family)